MFFFQTLKFCRYEREWLLHIWYWEWDMAKHITNFLDWEWESKILFPTFRIVNRNENLIPNILEWELASNLQKSWECIREF